MTEVAVFPEPAAAGLWSPVLLHWPWPWRLTSQSPELFLPGFLNVHVLNWNGSDVLIEEVIH